MSINISEIDYCSILRQKLRFRCLCRKIYVNYNVVNKSTFHRKQNGKRFLNDILPFTGRSTDRGVDLT